MANIRITDKQTVTPTGSDFMLINQAGSDKNTTLARLKTYMNGSTTLETVAQDTNSAINEVNTKATDASTGINGIKNTIGSGNLETTSQNIIGAVNEVNTKVGNEKLETVAENATGAINELNQKIGNVDIENDGDIAAQLNAIANNGFNGVGKSLSGLTDMNSFTTEGIYNGIITLSESILNLPLYSSNSGKQRIKIEVASDEPTKIIITQKITYQDGVFKNRIFIRTKTKGDDTWNNWIELINSSRVVNNFTTTESGFILDAQAGKTLYDLIGKLKYATMVVSISESNYYDYTIPSGTIPSGAFIIASFGDESGNKYVTYTKRVSDTVLRVGFNTSFTGTVRINIIYNIA